MIKNTCENCEYLKDTFGNFIECIKLHQFVDYYYWNNIKVENCPKDIVKDNLKEIKGDNYI